jgi:hypothetical protein
MNKITSKINKILLVTIIILPFFIIHSCNNASKKEEQEKQRVINCIMQVIQSDQKISELKNQDLTKQVKAMRNIDLRNCPTDFSLAYVDHIHALENAARVEEVLKKFKIEESIKNMFSELLINEFLGFEIFNTEKEIEIRTELIKQSVVASNNILETWNEVERSVVRHGAELPKVNKFSTAE